MTRKTAVRVPFCYAFQGVGLHRTPDAGMAALPLVVLAGVAARVATLEIAGNHVMFASEHN